MPASTSSVPTLRQSLVYFVRLLVLVRPYWGRLWIGIVLGFALSSVGIVTPLLTKLLVDEAYPASDYSLLHTIVLGTFVLSCGMALMTAIRSLYTQTVSGQLSSATTLLFFNQLQHQPMRFFDENRVGELLSRFGDVRSSLGMISRTFETLIVSGTMMILIPPILFILNWQLALLSIISIPVTTLLSLVSGRILRRIWKRAAEAQAELSALQVDILSHIRTLKLASAERNVYERTRIQTDEVLREQLDAAKVGAVVGVLRSLVKAVSAAVFMWYAWSLVLSRTLSLGEFLAFTAYVGFMVSPVSQVASLFVGFQQSAVALGRMFEYLDKVPEMDPSEVYQAIPPLTRRLTGTFQLVDVSFGYLRERPVLHRVTLNIPSGHSTAIVGPTGAGKSSLLRLLCCADTPTDGKVFIDGILLQSLPLRELRRQIAIVWQEVGLVRGTVRDNLVLGAEKANEELIQRAIEICQLTSTLAQLPEGLETPVAEWGATLSGGQRQRIALARALIRDTPILILDEATANIDVQTEQAILKELFSHSKAKTVIFVTHRIATAAFADQVCVIENGCLTAVGRHEQVLAANSTYQKLHSAAVSPVGSLMLTSQLKPVEIRQGHQAQS